MENDPAFIVGFIIGILLLGGFFGGICAAIASAKGRSAVGWFFGGFFMGFVFFPFFGIIMIIIVSCLSNLKEKRSREDSQERENRRLREQLIQEQIKNESFRQHAAARLDQHDVHLGVDTRAAVPAIGMGMPQFAPAQPMIGHDPLQIPEPPVWPEVPGTRNSAPSFQSIPNIVTNPTTNGAAHHAGMPVVSPDGSSYAVAPPALPPGGANAVPNVAPAREWHYELRGETRGPISDRQLVTLAKNGEITSDTLVWTEQLGDWKPAGQIKPLQPHLRTT